MKFQIIGFFHEVDPAKSGGKGKNLIALTRACFPVPPGFILTFDAYSQFRETGCMSEEVKEGVSACYRRLVRDTGGPFVAVRSSASAEDKKTASFAGQYDTYLYVGSEEELFKRILDCWHSLFSERAVAYRKRMEVSTKDLKMAVVVQSMIDPRAAGILFTAYSYHGENQKVMVVESGWGCGEPVVSGKITPDFFMVSRKEPFTVLERMPGKKDIQIRGGESGPVEEKTPVERIEEYSLTENQLARLCQMGIEIEHHFQCPQDIEWALDKEDNFFILQSRPITTNWPQKSTKRDTLK